MSAKAAYARYQPDLPILPPELWREILREATDSSQLFDTDNLFFEFSGPCMRRDLECLKKSLVPAQSSHSLNFSSRSTQITKRYVVRVCKQWNALATPFLYESLPISGNKSLSILSSTLLASRRHVLQAFGNGEENEKPLGWWTRRLDIYCSDYWDLFASDAEEYICSAIRCLPNLTTLNVLEKTLDLPPSIQLALQDNCINLEAINWVRHGPLYTFPILRGSLFPSLRALRIPSPLTKYPFQLRLFDKVHTLTIDHDFWTKRFGDAPLEVFFPAVEKLVVHVSIEDEWNFAQDLLPLPTFITHHIDSRRVKTLMVHVNRSTVFWTAIGPLLPIQRIVDACPNTQHLILSLDVWSVFPCELVLSSSTKTLSLRSNQLQGKRLVYHTLISNLEEITASGLKSLQFVDARNVKDIDKHNSQRKALGQLCEKRNWAYIVGAVVGPQVDLKEADTL